MTGWMALVGGGEFTAGCDFDRDLLAAAATDEVVVLATAAAYENPGKVIARATDWFDGLGARVVAPKLFGRGDASDPDVVEAVRQARFVYLAGGSPMHLRSVLKDSPVWEALVAAWRDGAVLAGAGAGGDVLCEHMVDPRGGAYTVGLGLLASIAVIPRFDSWSEDKAERTVSLAPPNLSVVGIPERTALLRSPEGAWSSAGAGGITVFRGGVSVGLDDLPCEAG
ncbi:MAG: Type 1 glutamine amidotransferase-like domain-containing protein [Acidimicrobiales bacterium]|nr:Type 1 glutamine amidotransferase-like domain-containing protein [Acidimicrobiales bacterium]